MTELWNKEKWTRSEIVGLLETDNFGKGYYDLLAAANRYARETFTRGYVFAQIGIHSKKCSGNCKFCSMAKDSFAIGAEKFKTDEEILGQLREIAVGSSDLFLMTTADFDREGFLSLVRKAKAELQPFQRLVANVGDFDADFAKAMKAEGVTGVYHIRRLREGTDTDIPKAKRESTISAAQSAGLELYDCIEPIGPEHSYDEIAQEIEFAKSLKIDMMAAMKRVAVPGTPIAERGEITLRELAKIVAVTLLCVRPRRSMNVHEPNELCMIAGVNQLYAEYGVNPRDRVEDTQNNRGLSVPQAIRMLAGHGWKC